MLNKKGDFLQDNLLELILAVMFVALLIIFYFSFFDIFDKEKETRESLLKSLGESFEEAEKVHRSSFFMYDVGIDLKLIYFGDSSRVSIGEDLFFSSSRKKNKFCFCFEKDSGDKDWICQDCLGLDKPVTFSIAKKVESDTIDTVYFFNENNFLTVIITSYFSVW